jgi:hypothetical protein
LRGNHPFSKGLNKELLKARASGLWNVVEKQFVLAQYLPSLQ